MVNHSPGDSAPTAPNLGLPAILCLVLIQLALLTIGITRDYRLKHEDNNALHATFARSHLHLGLEATGGRNYFQYKRSGDRVLYPNHPPGPALALAGAYGLTGADGPLVTRATAIAFHVLGTWLFYGVARRVLRQRWEVITALFIYVVLPESAFFGRMMNHEVMVLPAAILIVRGYWEAVRGGWGPRRWIPAVIVGAIWGSISSWAAFLAIAACAMHAAWELFVRRNPRALMPLIVLATSGAVSFGAVAAHLLSANGVESSYLRDLLASRSVGGGGWGRRILRIFELHWRYFGLTSAIALTILAWRAVRMRRDRTPDPAVDVGAIFLLAGAGYIVTFSHSAALHDYWQFLLLPASAIAIVLVVRGLLARSRRQWIARVLLATAVLDLTATTAVTLARRHIKSEGYCLEVVARLRRDYL